MQNIFKSKLIEKEYLSDDIIKIAFETPEGFHFEAGQFFNILFDPGDAKTMRSYSILNPPSKNKMESAVKLIDNGYASEIFKKADIGEEFTLRGPVGVFTLDKTNHHEHVFICTGTGVTPFHSMLFEHVPKHPEKKFTLIFGARDSKSLIYHDIFHTLSQTYTNFEYIPTLTRENGNEWKGLTGRVHEHIGSNLNNKSFYICGLKEMIRDVRDLLLKNGVDMKNIHIERYT
jgi:CDP-4-dehydro-6-deoxyglucose reductase